MKNPKVVCEIVESYWHPGYVSLRPINEEGKIIGAAGTLKMLLTEAGFKPGDRVVIVGEEKT